MTLSDIEVYAQCVAVLGMVNETLHTTFELQQMRARDFEKLRLKNATGTILLGTLEIMDKVCVGMLALVNELKKEKG